MTHPSLACLEEFGSPIYVPPAAWRVVSVERTDGHADGMLVFGDDGDLSIWTESVRRAREPLSIRVHNVQMASAPQQGLTSQWQRIIVDEAERSVLVDGVAYPVRVLLSHTIFSFELQLAERVVGVAGTLAKLESLAIVRLDGLALAG